MKSLTDSSAVKRRPFSNWGGRGARHAWIFLLPVLMVACGGSLGKIQVENVDAIIKDSETAIEQARLANAQTLSPETLGQAESALDSAKEAVEAKHGLEAMRLAYDAWTLARISEQEAMYRSQEEGLNAIIKRKESEIVELQANLRTVDAQLEETRTEMQQLDVQKGTLQAEMEQKVRKVERARQQTLHDYSAAQTELENLQSQLKTTQTQYLQAKSKAEEHERQIYQLRRELALAKSMAEEARKEAAEARSRAAQQAQAYSKQIERLDQTNAIEQRKATRKQAEQKARAYVQRQQSREPARMGVTSLTEKQIAAGKATINDWYLAWAAKDLKEHLNAYTQDASIERIVNRTSGEQRTYLNRTQMADALKKMVEEQWVKTGSKFEPDGESVIGVYRFSQLAQQAGDGNRPALYNVWAREVWVHQIGNQWKIFREIWRIYEDVPKYAAIYR